MSFSYSYHHPFPLLNQKIITDAYFNAPNMQVVEFLAKDNDTKTFMYQFDHRVKNSLMHLFLNETQTRDSEYHGNAAPRRHCVADAKVRRRTRLVSQPSPQREPC